MSTGTVTLFPLGNTTLYGLTISPGPIIWVSTYDPNGVGAFTPTDGKFHIATISTQTLDHPLVANGFVWTAFAEGEQEGVNRRPLTIPPAQPFQQVGTTYEGGLSIRAIVRVGEGEIWVSLADISSGPAQMARLERHLPPPWIRGPKPKPLLISSVLLPT